MNSSSTFHRLASNSGDGMTGSAINMSLNHLPTPSAPITGHDIPNPLQYSDDDDVDMENDRNAPLKHRNINSSTHDQEHDLSVFQEEAIENEDDQIKIISPLQDQVDPSAAGLIPDSTEAAALIKHIKQTMKYKLNRRTNTSRDFDTLREGSLYGQAIRQFEIPVEHSWMIKARNSNREAEPSLRRDDPLDEPTPRFYLFTEKPPQIVSSGPRPWSEKGVV